MNNETKPEGQNVGSNSLLGRLRSMAKREHDDLSIGDEAADEIERLRDAANVALGHLTGGMDGDWRDCDPVALLREVLSPNAQVKGAPGTGVGP